MIAKYFRSRFYALEFYHTMRAFNPTEPRFTESGEWLVTARPKETA